MVYLRVKRVKGRDYRYLVRGVRKGSKVIQKVVKYLGAIEPVNKIQRKKGGGRKPSVFARTLTNVERIELNTATRSNNAFAKERAKIILLSEQGKCVKEICAETSKEKRSVLAAIHAFNSNSVACLKQVKRFGRKPVFTLEQRAKIVQAVNTEPRVLGLNFTSWSLRKLRDYVVGNGFVTSISIEQLRQILLHGNKKFKKSRKWCYSNDPEFAKKKLL